MDNSKVERKNSQNHSEEEGGYCSKIIKYAIMFITIQIIMNVFKSFTNKGKLGKQNEGPFLNCMFEEGTNFDINFYLSKEEIIDYNENIEPVFSIKNRTFSFVNYTNQESFDNIVNITYNISYLLKKKNHKNSALYLIGEIKPTNKKEYRRQIKENKAKPSYYFSSENILKYIDNLNSLLNSATDLDDINSGREVKIPSNTTNSTNYINNLYYKNNFIFYIMKSQRKESIITFQTLNTLKMKFNFEQDNMKYFPIIYLSDFWSLSSDMMPINKTELFTFTLNLNFNFLNSYLFQQIKALQINENFMSEKFKIPGTKDLLVEILKNNTIPYLVILFTVNILHSIFSFLGFSSDITYYKKLKKLDGVYTKYIFFNIFSMVIGFFYILLKGSNFLVKVELFISLVIELWKLTNVYKVSFKKEFPFVELTYKIEFAKEEAKSYETEAITLMMKWLLLPVAVLYLPYRIYYYHDNLTFKSIKQTLIFIIEYIYFLLNIFGFILMTPQIYLNYKLKSVEHLPLKAMSYKFLNTIIDDLYAFAVKTPTMYRIFCFKDDVIFVIYLYQIYKYWGNSRDKMIKEGEKEKNEKIEEHNKIKEEKKDENNEKVKEKKE